MRLSRTFIYAVALAIAVTRSPAQNRPVKDQRFIECTLKLPFTVQGGTLAVCLDKDVGLPIQSCQRLCFVPSGEIPAKTVFGPGLVTTYAIESISELAGRVKIQDARSALAYLRIFSSPLTNYLANTPAGNQAAEIIAIDDITLEMAFGSKKWLEQWKIYNSGVDGVISAADSKKYKIGKTNVRQYQGDYVVTRDMIIRRKLGDNIVPYRVVERITPNGNYSLVSLTKLKLPGMYWLFPVWM